MGLSENEAGCIETPVGSQRPMQRKFTVMLKNMPPSMPDCKCSIR